jgi:MFS superfamily sulfate permease-like transporter
VGYKLAKPATFRQVYKMGIPEFIPFIVTIIGIVFTDLLIGISLGLITGIMYILWNNYRTPYHFEPDAYREGEPINIQLSEDVTFLNKAGIMNTLNHLPENSKVVIDASRTQNIHNDIIEIFDDFKLNAEQKKIDFSIVGMEKRNKKYPVKHFKDVVNTKKKGVI